MDVTIIRFPGTNCDFETARALEASGFSTTILPIAAFKKESLDSVRVKIVEKDKERAEYLANNLNNTIIINGVDELKKIPGGVRKNYVVSSLLAAIDAYIPVDHIPFRKRLSRPKSVKFNRIFRKKT